VILAGGAGTRLAPYTTILPKPLMPVASMPILEIIIRQLRAAGFTQVELAVGHLAGLLEAYFGDGKRWDVDIRYHLEHEPAGTAGPLALIEDSLDDAFLVMNGDVLTDLDFAAFCRSHEHAGSLLTAATCRRTVTLPLGALVRDAANAVVDYVEKPSYEFECSAGIYAMRRAALRFVERGVRFDLPDLVKRMIGAGERLDTYEIDGVWLDLGSPDDLRLANERFSDGRIASLMP
jgi:NDP-sugar pyrophosphorylase family protein